MQELYIIWREDISMYFHSLTPDGHPLWCDGKATATRFQKDDDAYQIIEFMNIKINIRLSEYVVEKV